MKALFNCSVIKNVYLRLETSHIELEITYIDNPNITWKSKKAIDCMSNSQYHKGRYEKAYNEIKQALLNNDKFVEVEI
jgi:hypothetical protein